MKLFAMLALTALTFCAVGCPKDNNAPNNTNNNAPNVNNNAPAPNNNAPAPKNNG